MAKKSTNAEIELRVNEIVKLVVFGYSYNSIVKYCKHKKRDEDGKVIKNWTVTSSRTISKYIDMARQKIQKMALPELEEAKRESIECYKQLLEETTGRENFTEARHIRARMDKIHGIEIDKIDVDNKGAITLDELKEEIIKVHKDAMKTKE